MEGLENELRNRDQYERSLCDEISDLKFNLRQLQGEPSNHWVMIIEEPDRNRIYHFDGADAKRLAMMAFSNNVMPNRVVAVAKLIEWSGDYKKAGFMVRGGEVTRNLDRIGVCDVPPQPLIEYK
jgi:hypothetical protein